MGMVLISAVCCLLCGLAAAVPLSDTQIETLCPDPGPARRAGRAFNSLSEDSDVTWPEDGAENLFSPMKFSSLVDSSWSADATLSEKSDMDHDGVINVCYWCDLACQNQILDPNGCYDDVDTYFDDLSARATELLSSLDSNLVIKNKGSWKPAANVLLKWFKTENGQNALPSAMNKFWNTYIGAYGAKLFTHAKEVMGCEAAFIVAVREDSVFAESNYAAVTNMFSICGSYSYGAINLIPEMVQEMAGLLTHEISHLLGLYHDGSLNDEFFKNNVPDILNSYEETAAAYQKLKEDCPAITECRAYGNACFMTYRWIDVLPTEFTACSVAYYNMMKFMPYIAIWQGQYDTSCYMAQSDLDTSGLTPTGKRSSDESATRKSCSERSLQPQSSRELGSLV